MRDSKLFAPSLPVRVELASTSQSVPAAGVKVTLALLLVLQAVERFVEVATVLESQSVFSVRSSERFIAKRVIWSTVVILVPSEANCILMPSPEIAVQMAIKL